MSAWTGNPCRLCLQGDSLNPISDDPLYLYAVFDASGVKISPRDELPQQLCNECFLFINKCNTFRNKCQATQKTLSDMIHKRKELPNTLQENTDIEFLSILPNADESIEILDEKIGILDIQNVDNIGDLNTGFEQLNADNRDTFDCFPNLNSDADILIQSNEELNRSNEELNQSNEDLSHDNQNFGDKDLDNLDSQSDCDDLDSDNENFDSATETFNSNNEDFNQNNNQSHSKIERNEDIKNINTITQADDKVPYTATYINRKLAKCNVCEKTMLPRSMRYHLKRHEVYGRVLKKGSKMKKKRLLAECDTCGKRMPKKNLLAHFLIHDGTSGELMCKHCGKVFDRPSRLLRHCRAKHGYQKVDKCSFCDFMGCSEYEVKIHEKAHKGGDALSCNKCEKTFKWKRSWEHHMAEHEDPKIQCPACPEKLHTSVKLVRHKRRKHSVLSFQCPHCSLTSSHKSTIQTHMKRKHRKSNEKDIKKLYKSLITNDNKTKKELKDTNEVLNSRKTVKVNENSLVKKTVKADIKKGNLEIANDHMVQTNAEDAVQIIEIHNIEIIDIHKNIDNDEIEVVYAFDETSTIIGNTNVLDTAKLSKHLNSDNKDIFEDVNDFNLDNISMNDDNENSNQDELENSTHKDLNSERENFNQFTDNSNDNNEALNEDYEVLNSDFEDLNLDSEILNSYNEEIKETITKNSNTPISNEQSDNQTNVQTDVSRSKKDNPKPSRKKANCNVCGLELLRRSLPNHLKLHELHGENLKKRFKKYYIYKRPLVECDTCGKKMEKKHLVAHFLTHDLTPGNLVCKHCGQVFHRPTRLLIHCRSKHGYEKVDKCSYCDFMGSSEYLVKYHEQRHHKGGDLYTCEFCGKNFKTAMGLSKHMAMHGNPSILCTQCPDKFRTPKQLSQHMVNEHKSIPDPIYFFKCPHCSHMTRNKRCIVIHMKKTHKATNFHDITKVWKNEATDRTEIKVKRKNSQKKVDFIKNPLSLDIIDTEEQQDDIDKNESVNFLSAFNKHLGHTSSVDNLDLTKDNVRLEDLIKILETDFNFKVAGLNINQYLNVATEVLTSNDMDFSGDLNADKDLNRDCNQEEDVNVLANVDFNPRTGYGQCNACGEYMLKRYLIPHMKLHDPSYVLKRLRKRDPSSTTVECDICPRKIKRHRFQNHLLKHANRKRKPIICEHCGLRFDCNASLLNHCKARHGYKKTAQCSYCSYMGINSHQVKLHERVHTGERPFSCNVCQKTFHLASVYKSHMATHDSSDKNKVECNVCKKKMFKRYYAAHKKIHEPNYQPPPRLQPRVQCVTCGAVMQNSSLKSHMAIHEGTEKNVACEHCDKTFDRRSRLLRHCRASHGYEKTDKCSYCEYRGCSRAEVTQHERTHTGEKPFACSICGATFTFSSSRQKHMAVRHGQGKKGAKSVGSRRATSSLTHSYRCALCHKLYARRAAARRHLINHHQQPYSIENIIKEPSSGSKKFVKVED